MTATPGLSVIVPCYNERHGLEPVLAEIDRALAALPCPHEVIVVDDGSTDGTADRLDGARRRVVRHPVNRGYGAALKSGARAAHYDLLAIIDADGTYPAERLADLWAAMADADMAVGARMGDGGGGRPRRVGKWILNALADYLSGQRIPDLNSGLRIVRRELWMRYERLYPDGFSLTTTLTLAALTNGHAVRWVPIEYRPRVGRSKIRPLRDMLLFAQLIVRTTIYFDPLKVFVPLSAALLGLGLVVGGGSLLLQHLFHWGRFLDTTTVLLVLGSLNLLAIGALADLIARRLP